MCGCDKERSAIAGSSAPRGRVHVARRGNRRELVHSSVDRNSTRTDNRVSPRATSPFLPAVRRHTPLAGSFAISSLESLLPWHWEGRESQVSLGKDVTGNGFEERGTRVSRLRFPGLKQAEPDDSPRTVLGLETVGIPVVCGRSAAFLDLPIDAGSTAYESPFQGGRLASGRPSHRSRLRLRWCSRGATC